MTDKPKHTTGWEDDRMASLCCDGQDANQLLSVEHDQPETCSLCGAKVRLVWNVYVQDVGATGQ